MHVVIPPTLGRDGPLVTASTARCTNAALAEFGRRTGTKAARFFISRFGHKHGNDKGEIGYKANRLHCR
jgi:hypothetical protein